MRAAAPGHKRAHGVRNRPPSPESARSGRGRPLKWLIWGFCLLLVAGLWWFVAAQTAFERQVAIDDAIRQNSNRAIAFEQYVRRTLEAADLVTRYVGNRYARGDVGSEFRGAPGHPAIISGNVARNETFLSVTILDPDGDVVATSIARPLPRINFAGHPAFRSHVGARDDGRLHVSRAGPRPAGQSERGLADPPAQPSGRLVRRRDRDQHPARAVHRFLPGRRGQSAGRDGR